MLVLTRKTDEQLVIPGLGITVRVIAIRGNAVRLGIQAPPDVRVLRQELAEARGSSPDRGPPGSGTV